MQCAAEFGGRRYLADYLQERLACTFIMEDFRGFWHGRGQYAAPRAELAVQNVDRETTEVECRSRVSGQQYHGFWPRSATAWVAFAGDVVSLVFRLSVLAAFLWFL